MGAFLKKKKKPHVFNRYLRIALSRGRENALGLTLPWQSAPPAPLKGLCVPRRASSGIV